MEICGEIMKKRYILLLVIIVVIIGYFAFSGGSSEQANITGERINVTTNDNFTWFNFDESAPGKDGYSMGIDIGNETYYFSPDVDGKMMDYSPLYNKMYSYEPSTGITVTSALGAPVFNIESPGSEPLSFDMGVDKPFSFTYSTGNQVGYNTDAKVIEQVFDANGNEL